MKMNDRVKDIALDCMVKYVNDGDGWGFSTEELEKLGETIVRECLDACCRANKIRHTVPPSKEQVVLSCMTEIEKHFGIESIKK